MRKLIGRIIPTLITGTVGLIIIASIFAPNRFGSFRVPLISVAIIVAGWATSLGGIRLITTHARRIYRGQTVVYSLGLIISAVLAAVFFVLDRINGDQRVSGFIFSNILLPMQAALGALLAVFLALAAVRMMHRRRSWATVWFLLSAAIVLITQVPLEGGPPILNDVRALVDAATTGGLRGLLIGVAIGTLATAMRVLLLIDRPQSE